MCIVVRNKVRGDYEIHSPGNSRAQSKKLVANETYTSASRRSFSSFAGVFPSVCCRSIKFIKCCVWGFNNLLFSCPLRCGLCFLFVVAVEKKADTHHVLICYVAANTHTHTHTHRQRHARDR
jgi:hypothetical protein